MADSKLQIMVHGTNISDLNPEIDHRSVEIDKIHRLENKNYLFIDLLLNDAKPGSFDILFKRSGKIESEYKYDLLERDPGSMERKGFDPSDVIYLITPDRYANGDPDNDAIDGLKEGFDRSKNRGRHGGDIQGIIDHIDYIKDMGFTQLWINPLLENDQEIYSYHGYSTTDYYKIDPRFGSNELYRSLSKIAQENGIGIIMDLILNHIGSEHWWMYDLPSLDWINHDGKFVQTNHTHHTVYDPHTPQSEKDLFTSGWFVETMPDLNQANPFLAKYL
ncbi:MAG: alpha-amlyase, partial [Euryarchaeota archaeon]|nr:alpha-amlyase [Euryarchaeota archaeon]